VEEAALAPEEAPLLEEVPSQEVVVIAPPVKITGILGPLITLDRITQSMADMPLTAPAQVTAEALLKAALAPVNLLERVQAPVAQECLVVVLILPLL
jgi:hypothetical protein